MIGILCVDRPISSFTLQGVTWPASTDCVIEWCLAPIAEYTEWCLALMSPANVWRRRYADGRGLGCMML